MMAGQSGAGMLPPLTPQQVARKSFGTLRFADGLYQSFGTGRLSLSTDYTAAAAQPTPRPDGKRSAAGRGAAARSIPAGNHGETHR